MEVKKVRKDLLAPEHEKVIEFSGSHPSRLLGAIPGILKDTLKISGSKVYEVEICWDVSGDPVSFSGEWYAKYGLDDRTAIWFKVVVRGNQSAKDLKGSATVTLSGWIESKVVYPSGLRKFVEFYELIFYSSQRRKYIEEGRILIKRIEDAIKKELGL